MQINTRSNLHMSRTKSADVIRLAATGLTVSGLMGISLPSQAITIFGSNSPDSGSYRNCASGLLSAGISPEAAAPACAGALNPQDVGRCVVQITSRTEIAADSALASCRQVRRPIEVSRCVVDINTNTQGQAVPGVLDYCTRSLLPERFADCVVGLGREIQFASNQGLETCISANDRPLSFEPTFIPAGQFPPQQPLTPAPTSQQNQTQPIQPAPAPTEPQNQTAPTEPQNQTPTEPAPTQNAPANQ